MNRPTWILKFSACAAKAEIPPGIIKNFLRDVVRVFLSRGGGSAPIGAQKSPKGGGTEPPYPHLNTTYIYIHMLPIAG